MYEIKGSQCSQLYRVYRRGIIIMSIEEKRGIFKSPLLSLNCPPCQTQLVETRFNQCFMGKHTKEESGKDLVAIIFSVRYSEHITSY